VPLRIAFDMDGVLADMDGALLRHAEALFGRDAVRTLAPTAVTTLAVNPTARTRDSEPNRPPAADPGDDAPASTLRLSERQHRRLWQHVATVENFWESLQEIEPGAVARLGSLAVERRWETIFLTKRPATAGATAQMQTQRWLEAKGFHRPSVFVVQGSRGRIAAALALDVVVDDRPENCLDVIVDSQARAVLVCRQNPQAMDASKRLGIGVVTSVSECLDALAAIEGSRHEPGVLERLKRLFRRQ
jgi:hypothetical protein